MRPILLSLILLLSACSHDDRRGVNPGDLAPNISGTDLSGKALSLASIPGKVILVNFWATWCGPCVEELPALESAYLKFKDQGLTVVGVVIDDTPESVQEYQKKYAISYPLIMDDQGAAKKPYEIGGVPESFFLDSQKRIMMVTDPEDSNPVARITGARTWDASAGLAILKSLLAQ